MLGSSPFLSMRLAKQPRDRDAVRDEIEDVLRRHAAKHGIGAEEVRRLSRAHVDGIVRTLFVDTKR
ncbi:MAG: hypothetical protein KIS73_19815 [Enhydrobacter sp.]|nr:hypothetical protein [Enhydrobacter sp.]